VTAPLPRCLRGQASVWQDVPTYLARHIDVLGSARCLIDGVHCLRFVDPHDYESLAARSTAVMRAFINVEVRVGTGRHRRCSICC